VSAPRATLLVVSAVDAERDAACAGLTTEAIQLGPLPARRAGSPSGDVLFVAGGVGPAAAAASAGFVLARVDCAAVLAVGIAGGFAPVALGELVVADAVVFAGLGAETAEGFQPLSQLGFGTESVPVDASFTRAVATATGAATGTVLTVATVTGSQATADELRARYPDARAEAMEGAGVGAAAALAGRPFTELRAISNQVGPRRRDQWRIPEALDGLRVAVTAVAAAGWTPS
jgi:futalosine hydrolase